MRLLNASGCLDALAAPEIARSLDVYVTKTVTPLPREGNDPVRIAETDVGLLNSIGLANPGIDRFVADVLPRLAQLGVPVWVSAGGFSVGDYVRVCALLDETSETTVIELNLSCPNVEGAAEPVSEVVAAARQTTAKPLFVKLAAGTPELARAAAALEAAGADGLSLVNTLRGLALDARTLRPRLARATGGLSGPALRPIALAAVYECRRATSLPIVGMGGVSSGQHALELVAAGAEAVALGTILFSDPGAPGRIRSELELEASSRGVASPDDIFGLAHGPEPPKLSTLDRSLRVLEVVPLPQNTCKRGQNIPLDRAAQGATIPAHGGQDAGAGARAIAGSTHGGAQARQRDPRQESEAQEGLEGRPGEHRRDSLGPAPVRLDREGVRHPHGRSEIRPRQGEPLPESVPDQPGEDGRRAFGTAAC
jgi:dihydroorotate dehydrogenase (NAD+) catalytic subunit